MYQEGMTRGHDTKGLVKITATRNGLWFLGKKTRRKMTYFVDF